MSSNSSNFLRKSAASAKNAFVKSSANANESREKNVSEMNGNDSIDERSENPQPLMTMNESLSEKSSTRAGAADHRHAEGPAGKLTKLMIIRLLRLHSEAMLGFSFSPLSQLCQIVFLVGKSSGCYKFPQDLFSYMGWRRALVSERASLLDGWREYG